MAPLFRAQQNTLKALQDTNSQRRRRLAFTLTQLLADRLGCFEITGGGLGGNARYQASL